MALAWLRGDMYLAPGTWPGADLAPAALRACPQLPPAEVWARAAARTNSHAEGAGPARRPDARRGSKPCRSVPRQGRGLPGYGTYSTCIRYDKTS
eukprot:scaffold4892_cov380-Prasinococcus_capsulatus_cf.AAC.2